MPKRVFQQPDSVLSSAPFVPGGDVGAQVDQHPVRAKYFFFYSILMYRQLFYPDPGAGYAPGRIISG